MGKSIDGNFEWTSIKMNKLYRMKSSETLKVGEYTNLVNSMYEKEY
jgi:hypothetical protein